MSCYGWERGTVKLPAKEFTTFRKTLLERLELRQDKLLNIANDCYGQIKKLKPKNKQEFIHNALEYKNLSFSEQGQIKEAILKDNKVLKPKKKDFKLDKKKDGFENSDLTVVLNKKDKTVTYHTDDNNHSIDDARSCFLGETVLSLLNRVQYTSHTGGYLETQTEYDVDAGCGARVSQTFGKYKTSDKFKRMLYKF
jgi:hypothetical protein